MVAAKTSGSIINISSVSSIRGYSGTAVYGATKSGLDGFTRTLARELGSVGIRVNSIAPGFFETELSQSVTTKNRDRIVKRTPLGRHADVNDIANAVLFLASKQADFITGQTLIVDGGITC